MLSPHASEIAACHLAAISVTDTADGIFIKEKMFFFLFTNWKLPGFPNKTELMAIPMCKPVFHRIFHIGFLFEQRFPDGEGN